jgi:hypothetical protein
MKGNFITTIATNLQTIIDGGWNGQIFPNQNVSVTKIYVQIDNQIYAEMAFEQEDILNVLKVNKTFTEKKLKV